MKIRSLVTITTIALAGCMLDEADTIRAVDFDPAATFWSRIGGCYSCSNVRDPETCAEYHQTCEDIESNTVAVLCFGGATLGPANGCFPFPSGIGYCCCRPGYTCPGVWPVP